MTSGQWARHPTTELCRLMHEVGFEPTRTNTTVLETAPLDRSGIHACISNMNLILLLHMGVEPMTSAL